MQAARSGINNMTETGSKMKSFAQTIILKSPYFKGGHFECSYSVYSMRARIHNEALCVQKTIFKHLEAPTIINMRE